MTLSMNWTVIASGKLASCTGTNLNANLWNSMLCDLDNNEDDIIHLPDQYMDTCTLKSMYAANYPHGSFTYLCVNVRSLVNVQNFCKLEALVASMPFTLDIIGVTETWIQPNSTGPYKNLKGYNFVSNNRIDNRKDMLHYI